MKSTLRSVSIIVLICCTVGCGSKRGIDSGIVKRPATDLARLDAELADMFALMFDKRDSLPVDYPETFERTLQEHLLNPATSAYPFNSLIDAGVNVVSSDDARIRIFYWLHPGTGSYWRIPAIVQGRTSAGEIIVHNMRSLDTTEEEGFGYWDFENIPPVAYQKVYKLNDSSYLSIGGGQFMGTMPWTNASAMGLHGDSLIVDLPLFRVNEGPPEAEVNLALTWYWAHPGEGDVLYPSILYDPEKRELSYPEMIESVGDVMWPQEPTGKTIRLRFNGTHFEPVAGE